MRSRGEKSWTLCHLYALMKANVKRSYQCFKMSLIKVTFPQYHTTLDYYSWLNLQKCFEGLEHGLSGSSIQMENTFIPELLGKFQKYLENFENLFLMTIIHLLKKICDMWQHEIHLKPIIRWLWVWSIFGPGLGRHKFQGNQAATGQWKDNWWNNRLLFCGRAPKVCHKKHYCMYAMMILYIADWGQEPTSSYS